MVSGVLRSLLEAQETQAVAFVTATLAAAVEQHNFPKCARGAGLWWRVVFLSSCGPETATKLEFMLKEEYMFERTFQVVCSVSYDIRGSS